MASDRRALGYFDRKSSTSSNRPMVQSAQSAPGASSMAKHSKKAKAYKMLYNLKTTAIKDPKRSLVLAPQQDKRTSPKVMNEIRSKTPGQTSGQAKVKAGQSLLNVKAGRVVDSMTFNHVLDAVGRVIQRKVAAEESTVQEENEVRLSPGDVRLVFKELKLIEPVMRKRGAVSSRDSAPPVLTQRYKDQDALIEQICALFFTDRVDSIDYTYLQDFLIVLMSTQVPRSDKISVL